MIVFDRRILFLRRPPPPNDTCPKALQNTHPFLETLRGITSPSHFFCLSPSSTRGRRSLRAWRLCLQLVHALNRRSPSRPASTVAIPSSHFSPPTPLFLSQPDRALEAMTTIGTFLDRRRQQHRCRETSFCNNMRTTTYCSFFYCFGNKPFLAEETSATLHLLQRGNNQVYFVCKGLVSEI